MIWEVLYLSKGRKDVFQLEQDRDPTMDDCLRVVPDLEEARVSGNGLVYRLTFSPTSFKL